MDISLVLIVLAVVIGFLMAFGVGANDVANAIGTSVGAKAISLKNAIIIAVIFESLGALLAGGSVTDTIRTQILQPDVFNHNEKALILGMLAASLSTGIWLLLASNLGWPVSTTHGLIGAIVGFGAITAGVNAVQWQTILQITLSWIISPLSALILAYFMFSFIQYFIFDSKHPLKAAKLTLPAYLGISISIILNETVFPGLGKVGLVISPNTKIILTIMFAIGITIATIVKLNSLTLTKGHREHKTLEQYFAFLLVITACTMAFAHGSNDVANAIGPIAAVISTISGSSVIPWWLTWLGISGIVAGLVSFGYKIIETIGDNITTLSPSRAFVAEISAATIVILSSLFGMPVSTTQTLVGAILGVGLARGISAINIKVVGNIFMSWLITLPVGAIFSVVIYYLLMLVFG